MHLARESIQKPVVSRLQPLLMVITVLFGCPLCFGGPSLVAQPPTLTLGRLLKNQVITKEVTLKNVSNDTIAINGVSGDCSCTVPTLGKSKLQPGEATTVSVVVTSGEHQGEFLRHVTAVGSGGISQTVPITYSVCDYINWDLKPLSLSLPDSTEQQGTSTTLTLRPIGLKKYKILSASTNAKWLVAKVFERQGEYQIAVRKQPEIPVGIHHAKISAKTDDPAAPEIELNALAVVHSNVFVKPTPLIFPATKLGKSVTMSIQVGGWKGSEIPEVIVEDAKAVRTETSDAAAGFEVTVVPKEEGARPRMLKVVQGGKTIRELPILVRGEK